MNSLELRVWYAHLPSSLHQCSVSRVNHENVTQKVQYLRCFKLHRSQFVTCWRIFLELHSKGLFLSLEEQNENILQFTFYIKREIRQSHVAVVQRQQRNVQNSVMHVHSCCFADLNLLLFCRIHCLRRRLTSCGAFAEQYLSCCTLLHHFGNLLR